MKHRILTISRQFGSGGRSIGKEVAAQLGIPCYDQELIALAAKESGFSEEYVKKDSESTRTGLLSGLFSDRVYDTPITQDVLWEAQKKIIRACGINCVFFIHKEPLFIYLHSDLSVVLCHQRR